MNNCLCHQVFHSYSRPINHLRVKGQLENCLQPGLGVQFEHSVAIKHHLTRFAFTLRSFTRSHWLTKHVFAKRQLLPGALGWEFRVSCVFLSWSFLFELFFWYLRPHCPWSISRVKMRRFLCSRQHAEYCMEALHINKAICTRSTQSERLTSQQDPTVTALAILSSRTGTSTSTRIRM